MLKHKCTSSVTFETQSILPFTQIIKMCLNSILGKTIENDKKGKCFKFVYFSFLRLYGDIPKTLSVQIAGMQQRLLFYSSCTAGQEENRKPAKTMLPASCQHKQPGQLLTLAAPAITSIQIFRKLPYTKSISLFT